MGKKHFRFFQTAETGNRTPNSGVKGSGANHYPRAPAPYSDNKDMLNSKFSSSVSLRAKQDIWNLIKGEVNAEGVENRAVKEIQHKWKDLLSRAKKDLSNRKRPTTGGGPKPTESPYTDIILDIIGESAPCLVGIVPVGEGESLFHTTSNSISQDSIPQENTLGNYV